MTQVPWSQAESIDLSRPYSFWQVTIEYRRFGDSRLQAIRFLPLGWQRMTSAAAEKLKAALEARKILR